MSGLAISEAPRPSVPLRFLVSSVLWGTFAGLWIAWQGSDGLASRWAPATVVLVHLLMLGVVGNAMLGALTQFLPVAAGSRLVGGALVPLLHAGYNIGLVVFVFAMTRLVTAVMPLAAALLGLPLVTFAALAGWSLWCGKGARWLRGGIGLSMFALAVTAALGVTALLTLAGWFAVDLAWVVDVHATTGTVGAVLTLIAVIGAVTLPMLQGTRSPDTKLFRAWLCSVAVGLTAGAWLRHAGHGAMLALTAVAATWALAAASLWLQAQARLRRNPTLCVFWGLGMIALALAGGAMVLPLPGSDRAILVGTLALAIGLPFVVVGMMLEIVGFLAWIHLRRVVPRGRQIPGVGRLMPERDKRGVLVAHVLAAGALLLAMLLHRWHAMAGLTLALAWLMTLAALLRCGRRVQNEQRIPAGTDQRHGAASA